MSDRGVTLLLALTLTNACDRAPARFETRVRLLEGVEATEMPAVAQVELESPNLASLRVNDIEAGKDMRRAFVGRDAVTLRWSLRPTKGARLEFALTSKPHSTPLTYRVRGGAPGGLRELHAGASSNTAPWIETRLALDGADGSAYVVEITAEAPGGRAAIAEPTLLGAVNGAKPNVIIYVVDCLRADRVGAFGSKRDLSPAIDAFARESVVLEQAWSCASWTKPSVACMFTGRYPPRHGARTTRDRLADGVPTLAEAFARAGYLTRAVVANPVLDAETLGFGRGFRSYRNLARDYAGRAVNSVSADAKVITDDAIAWLPSVKGRPFFLYLHSLDLHFPYLARVTPGRPKVPEGASEPDLYDSEFAYNDHEIGRLIEALRQERRLQDTIVVVTADHGEEFGEHGTTRHGHTLYQDLVHVPLVIRLPAAFQAGRRIPEPVSLIDLPETLLALAGLPPLAGADGVSLAPRLRGEGPPRPLPLFAEQISPVETLYSVRDDRYKAIEQLAPQARSLVFDLARDPEEKAPVSDTSSRVLALRRDLAEFMAQAQEGLHLTIDTDPDHAPVRVALWSATGFERAYLMGQRTGEPFRISPDAKTVTYEFRRSGFPHHVIAVPNAFNALVEMEIWVAGSAVNSARVLVGPGLSPRGSKWSFLPQEAARAPGLSGDRPIRLWYQAAPAGSRMKTLDPKLSEELRALGYIK